MRSTLQSRRLVPVSTLRVEASVLVSACAKVRSRQSTKLRCLTGCASAKVLTACTPATFQVTQHPLVASACHTRQPRRCSTPPVTARASASLAARFFFRSCVRRPRWPLAVGVFCFSCLGLSSTFQSRVFVGLRGWHVDELSSEPADENCSRRSAIGITAPTKVGFTPSPFQADSKQIDRLGTG